MRRREEEEVTEEEVAEDSGEDSEEDSTMAAMVVSDSVSAASGGLVALDMVMATPACTTTATPAPITTEAHGYESGRGEAWFCRLARRGAPDGRPVHAQGRRRAHGFATPTGKPKRRRDSAARSGPAEL
jgi:hypothetical protein